MLLIDLRETGLQGNTTYAKATPGIIRQHLFNIAAVVTVSVRCPGALEQPLPFSVGSGGVPGEAAIRACLN